MKRHRFKKQGIFAFLVWFLFPVYVGSASYIPPIDWKSSQNITALVFSGSAINENGETFYYFFRLQQQADTAHVQASLIDAQKNHILLFEEGRAKIPTDSSHSDIQDIKIGNSFLHFNPINNSWIFGIKRKDKTGFNFRMEKVQTDLEQFNNVSLGLELLLSPGMGLNGHITLNEEAREQFVSGGKSWILRAELRNAKQLDDQLLSTFCQFNNGSGFYFLKPTNLMKRSFIWTWDNENIKRGNKSKAIAVRKQENNAWEILIYPSNHNLLLKNIFALESAQDVIAGPVQQEENSGYCFIQQNALA